jgi:hypothetical protein
MQLRHAGVARDREDPDSPSRLQSAFVLRLKKEKGYHDDQRVGCASQRKGAPVRERLVFPF